METSLFSNHCAKSVRIRSYSSRHFPAFGVNTERYSVSLRIQSDCGKIWTRITPYTDTLYAVNALKVRVNEIDNTQEKDEKS